MAGSRIPNVLASLFAVLDELGIRYFAGGSVASSIHGIARFTQDVDIVADLQPDHAERLAGRLSADYYADAGQIRDAIRYSRAFNIIHFASGFKIDVFPLQGDPFHTGEMARSERKVWNVDENNNVELQVASAEDTILEKLVWYRRGGQTSDRQWSDVLGIVTSRSLDWKYLRSWATSLGVADLLETLFGEARQVC
jgi:hypothetical protein